MEKLCRLCVGDDDSAKTNDIMASVLPDSEAKKSEYMLLSTQEQEKNIEDTWRSFADNLKNQKHFKPVQKSLILRLVKLQLLMIPPNCTRLIEVIQKTIDFIETIPILQ